MVVFTCNNCGESLQKPKVEKHYFKCRKSISLTCVDCLKDFFGDEYTAHIKCVTEEERYSAKGTVVGAKKGEVKQESWVDMIKAIVDGDQKLRPSVRNLLNDAVNYPNVPRKRAKFINFMKNSRCIPANLKDIEEVWNVIEKYKQEQQEKQNGVEKSKQEQHGKQNGVNKRKVEDDNNNDCNKANGDGSPVVKKPKLESTNGDNSEDFSFAEKIKKIVSKKGKISKDRLREKVLKAYGKSTGIEEIPKDIIKKYKKALRKHPDIQIIDDEVSLK